ncbi:MULTISPECIES: hypothetical protein [unclassified Sphingomonas]|uniref:hypothetical protein n=1 Tax=unclassified Sphingomonas TaxID=196159 RepID=UPI0009289F95|nr:MULTISPECIES: hypothetical protein [unclassified Sphingomonas]MBN8846843.1 hypothetical protein [Sphingomonas sp.]OJV33767.1 MAG: hypothetical protein BGO24_09975 [Sphingomonas sp. 67-36]
MTAINSIAAAALSLWGLLVIAGVEAYRSIASQHVAGYPNAGQIKLYLVMPISIFLLLLLTIVVANKFRRAAPALLLLSAASLFGLMPYLMVWGGGV